MAMWGNKGPRNKIAGLLLHKQGQMEPCVKRSTQLAGHWKRMVHKGHLEGAEFQQNWEQIKRHTGTTKGPIHLFAKLMNDIGIEMDATHKWKVDGKFPPPVINTPPPHPPSQIDSPLGCCAGRPY